MVAIKKDKPIKKRQFVSPLTVANIKKTGGMVNAGQEITRSHGTIESYLRRSRQIINMMCRESGASEPSLADVVSWVIDQSASKSASTIRLYRAALSCYIESQFHAGIISETEFKTLSSGLLAMKSALKVKSTNTSSKKAKCASTDTIKQLIHSLNTSSSEYAKLAAILFMGSLIAGLRPIEWKNASLTRIESSGDAILTVMNAKATNGRSFGVSRQLRIPEKHVEIIDQAIKEVSKALMLASWSKIYEGCRKAIQRAGIKNHGKNISLYTARHQFLANMKNIYSKEEVALLAGHASAETAGIHYGKRRSGHKEFKDYVRIEIPSPGI